MHGRCPHCGELNEFTRAPATHIVYCQSCRRPFGTSALKADTPSGGQPAARVPAPRPPSRPGQSAPARPAPGKESTAAPRRPPPSAASASAEPTRPPAVKVSAVANKSVVPKVMVKEPAEPGKLAKLVYTSVEGIESEFELGEVNFVGRHPKNNIRLHDREVSKEHAVLELRAGKFFLRDLNSSNGSFVNNRKIRETELKDGDELQFGSMKLTFVSLTDQDEASKSVRDLVTILPSTKEPTGATHIHAAINHTDEDFRPASDISDPEVLKADYEKLRVAHDLARTGLELNFSALLKKSLDVAFSLFPCDNGVILLVEPDTGLLSPHTVKQRDTAQDIVLSSTIINRVLNERTSILLSDAFLDPRFSSAQSIISQGIRSAMTVPLIANNTVYGVMHLDSRQRIGAFGEKDLMLLKALAGQAAQSIANSRLVRKVEDDARTRGQLSRFLPPHVVEEMVAGKGSPITKGGRECNAAVLFCDIRGFTTLSENSSAQEVVDLLNEYFERLVEVVFEQQGCLDKFIGDALMAHWGTLPGDEDPIFRAVSAAVGFRDAIRELNRERAMEGLKPIGMGVGVNYGPLVAGYMGAKRRLEYTVIGDTVNTASRLCGLAGADQVLIAEAAQRQIADRIEAKYLGTRQVKGKEQGVEVYEAIAIPGRANLSNTGS